MNRQINLHNRVVDYTIRRSKKAKRLRLAVYGDGNLIVTIPRIFPSFLIDKYIVAKSQWIISKFDFFEKLNKKKKILFTVDSYNDNKLKALDIITKRIVVLNKNHKYEFNKVTIKNQKTCWGSCSLKKNLNFNYKVIFLPPKIRDYIIIHELCHLKEFNHSQKFWKLVATFMPNYELLIKQLKAKGINLI